MTDRAASDPTPVTTTVPTTPATTERRTPMTRLERTTGTTRPALRGAAPAH